MTKAIKHVSDLIPDHANANKGTERGRYAVEASLRETGAGRSIVVDKNGKIIAGNKTLESWADISGEIEIVRTDGKKLVVVQREDLDLDDVEGLARKLAYYDNRAGQLGLEWDAEQLFSDLNAGVDLSGMFFDDEIADILATIDGYEKETAGEDPGADVSKADELQAKWQVQLGDLWQLGDHRLICGDCTDEATVARVMGGEKAQGVFTSPPYAEQRKNTYGGIPVDQYVKWWRGVQSVVKNISLESSSFFVNIKPHCEEKQRVLYVFDLVTSMVRTWGWRFVDELCWTHQGFPGEPQDRFQNAFEPIYHFSPTMDAIKFRPDAVAYESDSVIQYEQGLNLRQRERSTNRLSDQKNVKHGKGKAYPRNVLRISSAASDMPDHPAAFPVDLPSFFIKAYSDKGDIWFEPFSGSGTTIIACEQLGRKCRAVELHPPYVAVALQRWADMTGKTPVRLTN